MWPPLARALALAPAPAPSLSPPPAWRPRRTRGDDASFLTTPPSPTLSIRSTSSSTDHYPTSLALRDNRPDVHTGLTSLTLPPNSPNYGHMCKSPFASTLAGSDGSKPSSLISPTIGNPDCSSHGEGQKSKSDTDMAEGRRKEKEREEWERQIVPCSDEPVRRRIWLVEPKSLHVLEALGGINGLFRSGQSPAVGKAEMEAATAHSSHSPMRNRGRTLARGQPVRVRAERAPRPRQQDAAAVYVAKVLVLLWPSSHSRLSIGLKAWQLWLRLSSYFVVGSMNDWQKEKQFKKLDEKKGFIRDSAEKVINVKTWLLLVEPEEGVPCDGGFLTGNNVVRQELQRADHCG
ncbi:hypothetical protein DFH11DRAFT_1833849 [Phellopilus nigrolimitatus]|nr:hypothetical protein DFH11DRAFT_1833849 [Phellopilus nigrolimitatus]